MIATDRSIPDSSLLIRKHQMLLKKWQSICIESSIDAPVYSQCSVVFLCLVNDSEFIQLMREGLIGVHMVKISIVARPVKLKSSKRLEVVGILGNHCFKIKVIAEAFHEFGIDDQPTLFLAHQQINEQRRFAGIGQMSLKHGGKDLCTKIFLHVLR